jgi:hypothetical protein
MDKFIKSGVDKQTVGDYFRKFRTINTARYAVAKNDDIPNVNVSKGIFRFDVDKYKTFDELKSFVDYVSGKMDVEKNVSQSEKRKSEVEKYKNQADKFIKGGISKKIVEDYLKKFKIIQDNKYKIAVTSDIHNVTIPKDESRFDILSYKSFEELEAFVDYVLGQVENEKNAGKKIDAIEIDAKPLVEKNGLKIYYATDRHACIKYKGGGPYSWCVSRDDSANMYNTYRFKYNEPAFYFVKDIEATEKEFSEPFSGSFKNQWHFFVIQVTKDDSYIVTNSNNHGDIEMSWNDIVKFQPKLRGMEEYFQSVPLTTRERELKTKFDDDFSDDDFYALNYEDKSYYLDIAITPSNPLSDGQFLSLPDDLKNKYISYGLELSDEMYKYVKTKPDLLKRFIEISLRLLEKYSTGQTNRDLAPRDNQLNAIFSSSIGVKKVAEISKKNSLISFLLTKGRINDVLKTFDVDYIKDAMSLSSVFSGKPEILFAYTEESEWPIVEKLLGSVALANASVYFARTNAGQYNHLTSGLARGNLLQLLMKYKTKVHVRDVEDAYNPSDADGSLDYIFDLYQSDKIEFTSGASKEDFLLGIIRDTPPSSILNVINKFGVVTVKAALNHSNYNGIVRFYIKVNKVDKPLADREFLPLVKSEMKKHSGGVFSLLQEELNLDFSKVVELLGGAEEFRREYKFPNESVLTFLYRSNNDEEFNYFAYTLNADKIQADNSRNSSNYTLMSVIENINISIPALFKSIGRLIVSSYVDLTSTNTMKDSYGFYSIVKQLFKKSPKRAEDFIDYCLQSNEFQSLFQSQSLHQYFILAILSYGNFSKMAEYVNFLGLSNISNKLTSWTSDNGSEFDKSFFTDVLDRATNIGDFTKLLNIFGPMLKSKSDVIKNIRQEFQRYYYANPNYVKLLLTYLDGSKLKPWTVYDILSTSSAAFSTHITSFDDQVNYLKSIIQLLGVNNVRSLFTDNGTRYMTQFLEGWDDRDVRISALIDVMGVEYMTDFVRSRKLENKILKENHRLYKQFFK